MDVLVFKNTVWDLLRSINEHLNDSFLPASVAQGLTLLQFRALLEIKEHGGHSVGSLGRALCVASANASSMCKRLEQDGLLERVRDLSDERVVNLRLTARGIAAVQEVEDSLRARFSPTMDSQSEETMKSIVAGLENLDALLQKLSEN
ncbi:MarR family winged helix-turn-helix transcriptional regulator [Zongyangia hominis]|uniref:MarR family transcriptional regulator n=1 Tax=Zongyangia hominis TaxID=2763677 RepID=A0A926EC46_9FIRM|nr:MarR family transcriptional regulator [Zongyangia hominis]MBC8571177.1 MarR family transcriptional regulator [Zongyangia hominis]